MGHVPVLRRYLRSTLLYRPRGLFPELFEGDVGDAPGAGREHVADKGEPFRAGSVRDKDRVLIAGRFGDDLAVAEFSGSCPDSRLMTPLTESFQLKCSYPYPKSEKMLLAMIFPRVKLAPRAGWASVAGSAGCDAVPGIMMMPHRSMCEMLLLAMMTFRDPCMHLIPMKAWSMSLAVQVT